MVSDCKPIQDLLVSRVLFFTGIFEISNSTVVHSFAKASKKSFPFPISCCFISNPWYPSVFTPFLSLKLLFASYHIWYFQYIDAVVSFSYCCSQFVMIKSPTYLLSSFETFLNENSKVTNLSFLGVFL